VNCALCISRRRKYTGHVRFQQRLTGKNPAGARAKGSGERGAVWTYFLDFFGLAWLAERLMPGKPALAPVPVRNETNAPRG
jgi:hypothetical protein